jgi:3'-5' exonuclease
MGHQIKNILFIDIECVAAHKTYAELPERFKNLWQKKAKTLKYSEEDTPVAFNERAAIYAEFGRVLCIGIGAFYGEQFRTKTVYEETEKDTLLAFKKILEEHPAKEDLVLCAHNGKEFDFPYLSRRMLINGIKLPYVLDNSTKKPWEIQHLDTLEYWKFGDYKSYTSLELLAAVFDVPSSKTDIDGSMVNQAFYHENAIEKIKTYCQNDVIVLTQIYLRMNNLDLIPEEQIVRV